MTPLRRNAVVALLDAALPNHARLPIMAQSPWEGSHCGLLTKPTRAVSVQHQHDVRTIVLPFHVAFGQDH